MVFRASKIRKYRFVMSGDSQKPRALTVPLPPKLHTAERAQLKDDLIVCSQWLCDIQVRNVKFNSLLIQLQAVHCQSHSIAFMASFWVYLERTSELHLSWHLCSPWHFADFRLRCWRTIDGITHWYHLCEIVLFSYIRHCLLGFWHAQLWNEWLCFTAWASR